MIRLDVTRAITSMHTAAVHTDHAGGDGARGWLVLIAAAIVAGLAYRASIRLHPYRNCRRCTGSGKHRGAVFTRGFRACDRCGGTGRQLRTFAKEPD
jgi:hypothetical protein